MKLYEIAPKRTFPLNEDEIRTWLAHASVTSFKIRPTGEVDVGGDVYIRHIFINGRQQVVIPFQFGTVDGEFDCSDSPLISLKGAPRRVGSHCKCHGSKITSLEHAPYVVGGRFTCFQTPIRSLSGVNKIVGHVGTEFVGPTRVSNVLGLLLIQGLKSIRIDGGAMDEILNKYLPKRDVLGAQEELLAAGFSEQAKL